MADDGFAARLDEAIVGAAPLVEAYFDRSGPFAGALFDELGVNQFACITSDDLLATTLLDISFTASAVRRLLIDDVDEIGRMLANVRDDVDLWNADEKTLQAAGTVWDYLRTLRGVDWVIAGKLLARKRPRLVPIFDSVVKAALDPPADSFWRPLAESLRSEERRARIDALRPPGGEQVSLIRLLDVAVWMKHSRSRNALKARGEERS